MHLLCSIFLTKTIQTVNLIRPNINYNMLTLEYYISYINELKCKILLFT